MAIKTQLVSGQRRIITKVVSGERRVSCSCCGGEPSCCYFPASGSGRDQWGNDDLPDSVAVNWSPRPSTNLSKSGATFSGGGITLQIEGGQWRLSDDEGARTVGVCLFRGSGEVVDDLWEESYVVDSEVEGFAITVNRTGLCSWSGSEIIGGNRINASLSFDGNLSSNLDTRQKWNAGISVLNLADPQLAFSEGGTKSVSNTPVGEYLFSGEVRVIVSES